MANKHSIHTIAKEVGLSATTVSLIINGVGKVNRISDASIKRVQDYLEEIDYKPNVLAQALRTGKTNVIGMLVEDISDPFFSAIARGVEVGMEESGYRIFFMSTKNKLDNATAKLDTLKGYKVDGYIIAPTPGLQKEVQKLLKSGKPVVLFDRYFPGIKTCNIIVDNEQGAVLGTEELIANGYKNIGFVTLVSDQIQMADRKKGYQSAIAGSLQKKCLVLEIPYNQSAAENCKMIKAFLKSHIKLDGLLFATNYLAIAGLQAIKDLALKPGRTFGVVGFDDNTNFALFTPSVSAIAQPVDLIAKSIVTEMLAALSKDTPWAPNTKVLKTSLIRRDSSAKN